MIDVDLLWRLMTLVLIAYLAFNMLDMFRN